MNEPWNWTMSDLEELIKTKRKESIDLDYKESRALQNNDKCKNEISKDISAFANSAGGTIIYGIREDKYIPIEIDEGIDITQISKEWMEQVISSRIQRKIEGVRIHQVDLNKASGKAAYIIYIPQSKRAPHQAYDKKFYKRHNFESTPMEEYEIRDVGQRNESPLLRLTTDNLDIPAEINFDSYDQEGEYTSFDLGFALDNESVEPAHYAVIRVFVDQRLRFLNHQIKNRKTIFAKNDEEKIDTHMFEYVYGASVTNITPVFYGLRFPFFDGRVIIRKKYGTQDYFVGWEIFAPKMSRQTNTYILKIYQDKNEKWFAKLSEIKG